jgi:hypothetical protein
LVAFVDVHLPSGMTLRHCSVFAKDGRAWAGPPAKQIVGRDGMVSRTSDGKTRFEACVTFVDRATQQRWSDAVIAAVRTAYPDALA